MIVGVEAHSYRCLRWINQPLDSFRVLVGPNASGKSTFLDVLRLVRDVVTPERGVEGAVADRTRDPRDLIWLRQAREFQIAVELRPPALPGIPASECPDPRFRYELAIGCPDGGAPRIEAEALWFWPSREPRDPQQRLVFPEPLQPPLSVLLLDSVERSRVGRQKVVAKVRSSGKDYYQWRPPGSGAKAWNQVVSVGRSRAALAFLPASGDSEEDHYAAPRWVREYLSTCIRYIQLDVTRMRQPSPPNAKGELSPDGSNLAWVVRELKEADPGVAQAWTEHIRLAFPLVEDIVTFVREEDRHCLLKVVYRSGAEVPTWLLSDGTLRFIALTLIAYYPWPTPGLFMIEEPENGIHPAAVGALFDSLRSMWEHQVLLATHSPALLRLAKPEQVLAFAATEDGATDVIVGEEHPRLREWQGQVGLDTLNASGVLS